MSDDAASAPEKNDAGRERRVASLHQAWEALNRDLLGAAQFSAVELSERSGASPELLTRLWQSLGFPPVPLDEPKFTATDIETVRALVGLSGETPDEALLVQLTRMAGQTQARLAEALAELIAERDQQAQGADLIARNAAFVKSLEPLLSYVWRRHLLAALGRLLVSRDGDSGRVLAVGFADLVSFTALTRRLQDAHLASVVERFEALVYAHVPHNHGRIVKFLGDEVFFVADSAKAAAAIALGLSESIAGAAELPDIRVGIAQGPVVALGGDFFGQTVNLASRLVDEARAGTVLVDETCAAALAGDAEFALQRLRGRLNLKGIGRVHAAVLRRPVPPKEGEKKKPDKPKREKRRRDGSDK